MAAHTLTTKALNETNISLVPRPARKILFIEREREKKKGVEVYSLCVFLREKARQRGNVAIKNAQNPSFFVLILVLFLFCLSKWRPSHRSVLFCFLSIFPFSFLFVFKFIIIGAQFARFR